jgi:tRNA nucleotidyltransferase (CCA-adding enzyme)
MAADRKPNLDQALSSDRHALLEVCRLLETAGGRAWLVGGAVRDGVLGRCQRDLDLEVFGLPATRVREVLGTRFDLDLVGESFGIIKVRGTAIDVGLPRRESKAGRGHREFDVATDPDLSLPEAAARRDFTLNAIYYDPLNDEIADPFGGLPDLLAGRLRHTGPAFSEDPLRVLRGMQFVARFELKPVPETVALCRTIDQEGLPPERIFEEWRKLLVSGVKPSLGLNFLRDTTWVRFFPELEALIGCPQDPEWHPEGDVWIHTLHCLDVFAEEKVEDEWEDLVVGLAVLCHDLGKPGTTEKGQDGRIRALEHQKTGVEVARTFLERMTSQKKLIQEVLPLVAEHMAPAQLERSRASDAAVRRLAKRVGRIDRLLRVARADALGRPPLPPDPFPAGPWLADKARHLEVENTAPQALVQGRDLVDMGWQPGPHFKGILDRIYRAQLDGKFSTNEGGRDYARKVFGNPEGDGHEGQV